MIQVVYCVICVLPLFAFALGGLWDEDAVVGGGDEKGDGKGGGGGIGDGIGDGIGNGGVEGNKKGEGRREEDKGLDSGGGNGTEEAATIQKGVPEIQTWRGFVGELRRPEYALFALYFSLCMTRFSWVLGTLDPTMRSLANATAMGTPTVNFTATATATAAAAAAAAAAAEDLVVVGGDGTLLFLSNVETGAMRASAGIEDKAKGGRALKKCAAKMRFDKHDLSSIHDGGE